MFCNDRREVAGRCKHVLAVINLQQQAVGTPCQQKWYFRDKGLTINCLQEWHMYRLMVIHLCRTETLLLIYHQPKWFKTDGAPAVPTRKPAVCAPANPKHSSEIQSVWDLLTVHVTCTDVELRTTGLCMLTTTSPSSFCTRRWSTPCAVGLMSRGGKGYRHEEEKKSTLTVQHNRLYLVFGQARTSGWGHRAPERSRPWWWTGRPYWVVGPWLWILWSSHGLPLSASCYSPTDCR